MAPFWLPDRAPSPPLSCWPHGGGKASSIEVQSDFCRCEVGVGRWEVGRLEVITTAVCICRAYWEKINVFFSLDWEKTDEELVVMVEWVFLSNFCCQFMVSGSCQWLSPNRHDVVKCGGFQRCGSSMFACLWDTCSKASSPNIYRGWTCQASAEVATWLKMLEQDSFLLRKHGLSPGRGNSKWPGTEDWWVNINKCLGDFVDNFLRSDQRPVDMLKYMI